MLAYPPPLRRILASIPPISRSLSSYFPYPVRRRRLLSAMSVPITASNGSSRRRLRGVVFDMDGTLTVPVIDFPAMYRAVLGEETYASMREKSVDILHHIEAWGPQEQQRAYETIARFERDGIDRLQIMPGLFFSLFFFSFSDFSRYYCFFSLI